MDTKEFRKRLLRAYIRSEYFYLPVKEEETVSGIYILAVDDETGNPVNAILQVTLSYYTQQLYHDVHKDPDTGSWVVVRDEYSKGYAFETNYDWRNPVPNPSQYEVYPVPVLSNIDITAEDATVSKQTSYVTITPDNPTSRIHIENLPVGNYSVNVYYDLNGYRNMQYYPTYYNNERYSVSHSSGYVQIDRNGNFSGFYYQALSDPNDGHPTGYDFYGITDKFAHNTMPVSFTVVHNFRVVFTWIDIPGVTDTATLLHDEAYLSHSQPYTGQVNEGITKLDRTSTITRYGGYKVYMDGTYLGTFSAVIYAYFVHTNKVNSVTKECGFSDTIYLRISDGPSVSSTSPMREATFWNEGTIEFDYSDSSYTSDWADETPDGYSNHDAYWDGNDAFLHNQYIEYELTPSSISRSGIVTAAQTGTMDRMIIQRSVDVSPSASVRAYAPSGTVETVYRPTGSAGNRYIYKPSENTAEWTGNWQSEAALIPDSDYTVLSDTESYKYKYCRREYVYPKDISYSRYQQIMRAMDSGNVTYEIEGE